MAVEDQLADTRAEVSKVMSNLEAQGVDIERIKRILLLIAEFMSEMSSIKRDNLEEDIQHAVSRLNS